MSLPEPSTPAIDRAAAWRQVTGTIFDVQRFSIHDGPGIRTTVFVKGCPLRCAWCHNPEGLREAPQLAYTPSLCIGCGYCVSRCKHNAHTIGDVGHRIDRSKCVECFACVEECYSGALEIIGRTVTVGALMGDVLKDAPFYEESGGGLTVSGGEPLAQFDFVRALLATAKAEGLDTCLETCGLGSRDSLLELASWVDLFLYDYKETNPALHRQYTGQDNTRILENLSALDELGATIVLRCPIIPGVNNRPDHYEGIARTAEALAHCHAVHLMGYHRLGTAKQARLGVAGNEKPFDDISPEMLADAAAAVRKATTTEVVAF